MTSSKLLLSYYGDDFTGSTDVMEALALNGIPTVLFMDIPDEAMLARFSDCRAVGIAGTSRSETPDWMEEHLTPVFEWLRGLDADLCHYKVCSTFDSSPGIGSIGRAIEIGKRVFDQEMVPLVVGAPQLKRYTAFGHLFAAYQGQVYRIDRHPVMSRHPVTPMHEADLARHLAGQTSLAVNLADITTLAAADADRQVDRLAAGNGILLLDVDSAESQKHAGRNVWRLRQPGGSFVAGSSGVEYALINAWRAEGIIQGSATFTSPGKVDRLAVVSGSVSPTTERQIRHAMANGFDGVALDPLVLLGEQGSAAIEQAVLAGLASLRSGRSVILYTALGPSADLGGGMDRIAGGRHRLGGILGDILRRLVEEERLPRAVIAGGDTSSHALKQLRVQALTTRLPLPQTPGSPLSTAHGIYAPTNGIEIALKGGQVGNDSYFAQIRDGLTQ